MIKKVLVLGGTGAMGVYLVPALSKRGYHIDVVSLDDVASTDPNVTYIQANAMDDDVLRTLLRNGYDGIVDFMIYSNPQFRVRLPLFAAHTKHYIFLSTYRVYAGEIPITERSPRLLDVATDDAPYLARAEEEYSLYKAMQEDMLRTSDYRNWSIVRPAITYSKRRFQLVTLEANVVVWRALNHKRVVLPRAARDVQATMSWAGDVADMIAAILFNDRALCETYTVATAEHHTWGEIADYYRELIGLEVEWVDTEAYLSTLGSGDLARYQLIYDRLLDRVVDNSKILSLSGKKQEQLMPLKEGLRRELANIKPDTFVPSPAINRRQDDYFADNH